MFCVIQPTYKANMSSKRYDLQLFSDFRIRCTNNTGVPVTYCAPSKTTCGNIGSLMSGTIQGINVVVHVNHSFAIFLKNP
jgi:hypothetical protein